ncbi:cyclic beta-1,2-glucan synthetase [Methylobacter tundripaludum]|uniref:Cyclic beta-1,2-glucan synthetase n=1 Tax=Methylobacter tundripaludum TaxID=173365 RepID=A0A2S6H3R2_9GAMM|nr:glucoamylase family protein [Methylobacter tundripaludum]PPK72077.1 cyclic beta-1,2-glucan synthetase [Methylobacter tundripaludum]
MIKLRGHRQKPRLAAPGGEDEPIRFELFSNERLEQHAVSLAKAQKAEVHPDGLKLMPRVRENSRVLFDAYQTIGKAAREHRAITPAAEWLLDNFHVIEEQINDINLYLPEKFYKQLPKLTDGFLAGYPRVYGIAWALVAHTDSRFSPEQLACFMRAYQQVQPLSIGELWALPISLRIVMIENLRRLALKIMRSQAGRQLADEFIDQADQPDFSPRTEVLPAEPLRQAFAVQLVQRLHEPHPGTPPALDFLNRWLGEQGVTLDEVVHREHAVQIAANLTVRNIITSMRTISAFDWPQFVEDSSLVDKCLSTHPVYSAMDFLTRDRYRHAIEDLAKRSPYSEVEIAAKVIDKLDRAGKESGADQKIHEPGYYLIGPGRGEFEQEVGFNPTFYQKLLRAYIKHATFAYLGSLGLCTLILLALPLGAAFEAELGGFSVALITLLALFPASDIATGLVNRLVIAVVPPRHLPRLELKDGIPDTLRTFVVVPTMFVSEQNVKKQIDEMEVHYLSNPAGDARFALLSDWVDADQETLPEEALLLRVAIDGVDALNAKYGEQRFFLYHRKRVWNPGENTWMGWERKRGKLHEFNRLLRGAQDTSFMPTHGQPAFAPPDVRYVITLDADTKLPIDSIRQLVGTAAHPLNWPVLDPVTRCVVRGYSILQPRVTPTLPQRREHSLFHQLFSGACGMDAYSTSVSEVYQDLFELGSYSGKGLYEVDTFEAALAGRVPENTLLSHDLFESVFARCAFVSDIELYEEFPSHTEVAASRSHRWARGDWQLLPWIFGPLGKGMPLIGRWKMLDNLRRTFSAPGAFLTLLAAWTIPNAPQGMLIGIVLIALAVPALLAIAAGMRLRTDIPLRNQLRVTAENVFMGLSHSLITLAMLAQQSWLMTDAIVSTLVRLFITRRKLLRWVTALQAKTLAGHALGNLIRPLASVTIVVVCAATLVLLFNSASIAVAAPFLLLWLLSPVIAHILSLPPRLDPAESLLPDDALQLRQVARRTWRFFTTFVTERENYLPPDNFQEDPAPVIAHRSSPTNFGLYLLSVLAAHDFGWLGLIDTVDRLEATLNTLNKMSRLHGHFYNWYDTQTLHPLEPRYVSTVDSGNLAGHLLVLIQGCKELTQHPHAVSVVLDGIADTHRLLLSALAKINDDRRMLIVTQEDLQKTADKLGGLLACNPVNHEDWLRLWRQITLCADGLLDLARTYAAERGELMDDSEVLAWATLLHADIHSHERDIENLGSSIHFRLPLGDPAQPEAQRWTVLTRRLDALAEQAHQLFVEMDFRFLYDLNRHLFSLGYRVDDGIIDDSYYDLLASEARLTSLIAIAKREVPSTHWFHLGRRVTRTANGTVLLSWSGSMFEYLMPSLVTYTPRYSLLDQACRLSVQSQIEYGKERKVPWGVSESAFNGRDRWFTYQYSAFGVPGLGMKRGLAFDLVIAPYATALAAMYHTHAATVNFESLEKLGALGRYGFFEALDFTPIRLAEHQKVAFVRCYMAHHQGMSLVALANVVYDGVMRRRFHSTPIIQGAEMLLQERVPQGADSAIPDFTQAEAEVKEIVQPAVRREPSPMSLVPSAQLLSNGRYAVMITAAGSGYSVCEKLAVTRWREDVTRDCWGSYIYLRNLADGRVWSAGYQPTAAVPDRYEVVFLEDRVRISREDGTIASHLEIIVSPEDDAEIRCLSLTNNGSHTQEIEVTSYSEIVLAPPTADSAHPAFSNLFIQTEFLPQACGLIAQRRPRAGNDPRIWAAHVLACNDLGAGLQYETDRVKFCGRGQTLRAPAAVVDGRPLSNTVGAVLDPIFSLRTRVGIEPGATVHLTFTTLVAPSREVVEDLADKYHNAATFNRVSDLAWTHAQIQLRHLRIKPDEAQLFQSLANRLLYADSSLRANGKLMQLNTLNVTGLWRLSISGDRPIVLLRLASIEDRAIADQLLRAHEYWRMKCLSVDLVILNEKEITYSNELQTLLEGMVRENQAFTALHEYGGYGDIFVLRADQLTEEESVLLQTSARAVLLSTRGTLAEQLTRHPKPTPDFIQAKVLSAPDVDRNEPLIATADLEYFNGLGGFADDGREYVIVLGKGQWTPAPWINVIANAEFGFTVSELGGGCTWSLNSRMNQLTPWSNDPVSDPPGEVFYIQDDETGDLWTPTALPIRVDNAGYVIRHGQGYSRFEHASHGIHSELLQFVSSDDPVKISTLTLKNNSGRPRKLSVTAYVEWVLGASRTNTAPYIVTELDQATGALFAYNHLDMDFGRRIAFVDLAGLQTAWTCNRTEFIGRNGSLDAPIALTRSRPLKNRVGAGLDPCAAMTAQVELAIDQSIELVFLFGQGSDREHAGELVKRYRAADIQQTFTSVKQSWDKTLRKIQVKTPDRGLDLMLNGWLLYQTLSCRMWARAAFYQAGGAFGFRDQLQDCMALAVARPDLVRAHILRAATHQFVEGDVQHWWHPPSNRGVRTHFSDDLIWLPYVVSHYVKVSGDRAVLDEITPFLAGPVLEPEQEDAYFEPAPSEQQASLFEHCARTLDLSLKTGAHGLPLMGSGDWNDGMNRVGHLGKGESVWLAWFLIATLSEFADVAELRGDAERAVRWREHVIKLKIAVEAEGWDVSWYRRAYYDDGTPLGSAANAECRIDSLAQSWGVISGAADPERARQAMNSAREYLIRYGDDLVLLFTPPFDKTLLDPGYIKGYLPGVRENGGQYTHAAVWCVIAYAMLGDGDQAVDLLHMLNPINRTANRAGVYAYKVEPYVIAADIYAVPPHVRRGGWTWYTGAAGWFYRAGIEWLLGLNIRAGKMHFNPCIPRDWRSYSLSYQHEETHYDITVNNPDGVSKGIVLIELDGVAQTASDGIPLLHDGQNHQVLVVMG